MEVGPYPQTSEVGRSQSRYLFLFGRALECLGVIALQG